MVCLGWFMMVSARCFGKFLRTMPIAGFCLSILLALDILVWVYWRLSLLRYFPHWLNILQKVTFYEDVIPRVYLPYILLLHATLMATKAVIFVCLSAFMTTLFMTQKYAKTDFFPKTYKYSSSFKVRSNMIDNLILIQF